MLRKKTYITFLMTEFSNLKKHTITYDLLASGEDEITPGIFNV